MDLAHEQIESLKQLTGSSLAAFNEGGCKFILIEKLKLPAGCSTSEVAALLCLSPRDGYPSRLFLSEKINCPSNPNWTAEARINERSWYAVSWMIDNDSSPATVLSKHLKAFR